MDEKIDRRHISEESLENLRKVVIELFSEGLFHHVGIRDIAKKAGVGPQTIYKYFGNKDKLVYSCIKKDLEALNEKLVGALKKSEGKGSKEAIRTYSITFATFYLENLAIAEIVFQNIPARNWVSNPEFIQYTTLGMLAELLNKGKEEGEIRSDIDTIILVQAVAGAVGRYLSYLLDYKKGKINLKKDAEQVFKLLWPLVKT